MRTMTELALVGYGFMGSAIARAVKRTHPDVSIVVAEKNETRAGLAREEVSAVVVTSPKELAGTSVPVILAIKPQDLDFVGPLLSSKNGGPMIVSVLAGIPIERIRKVVGTRQVVRLMPSLTADIAQAVVGVCIPEGTDQGLALVARSVAKALGRPLPVPEHLMHAVTAVSGSGVAVVFEFIHAMALGATREGIPYSSSLSAVCQVVSGAANLIDQTGVHPEEMVSRVCSPAGTTVAGITELHGNGFSRAVIDAIHAAAERSRELEQ